MTRTGLACHYSMPRRQLDSSGRRLPFTGLWKALIARDQPSGTQRWLSLILSLVVASSILSFGARSASAEAFGDWSFVGSGTCASGRYCLYTTNSNSGMSASQADSFYPNNPNFANGGPNMNDNTYYINNQKSSTVNFCQAADYHVVNVSVPAFTQRFAAGYQQFSGVSSHRGNACLST